MAFLIRAPNGEQMIVQSLDGHEDCAVLNDAQPDTAIDDLKAMKRDEVNNRLAAAFLAGFVPADGPLAGHTLQVRDVDDRTNWLTSQAAYSAAVAAGEGDVSGADFRTEANDTITVTFAEGLQALLAMAAWGKALFGKSWTVKDQVDALTDAEVIQAFDVAAAWDAA